VSWPSLLFNLISLTALWDIGLAILAAVIIKDIRACPQIRKLFIMYYQSFFFHLYQIQIRILYFPLDVMTLVLSCVTMGLTSILKVTGHGDHFTLTKGASVLIMK
jgi:hypothetical protein